MLNPNEIKKVNELYAQLDVKDKEIGILNNTINHYRENIDNKLDQIINVLNLDSKATKKTNK